MNGLALLGSILWLAAPGAAGPGPRVRVAVVPFESVAGVVEARQVVTDQVAAALAARGADVVHGEPVLDFLRDERARYYDSLDTATTVRLAKALDVDAVLFGQVLAWEPRPLQRDPVLSISANLVSRDGEVLWGGVVSASGADQEDGLGAGRILELEPLSRMAVGDLLKPLPVPFEKVRVEHSAGALGLPRVHRKAEKQAGVRRILVLPVENLTDETGPASRVMEALLQTRLAERADLEVVSPGQMRRAIVARSLPPPWMMSTVGLNKLAQEAGARYVLAGSVLSWKRAPSERGFAGWEAEIHLELTDVEAERVVWTGIHRRNGGDSEGFLKLGAIPTLPAVADRVVSELLEAFNR